MRFELRALSPVEIAKVIKRVGSIECTPKSCHALLTEFCRYGIVNVELHEIANPDDPEEDQVEVFEQMPADTVITLGQAIMLMSMEEK